MKARFCSSILTTTLFRHGNCRVWDSLTHRRLTPNKHQAGCWESTASFEGGSQRVCGEGIHMLRRITSAIIGFTLIATLLLPIPLAAQNMSKGPPRYTVTDLGALGSAGSQGAGVNNTGAVAGFSWLPGSPPPGDPNPIAHAILWRSGVMTDLGTLGGWNSFAPEGASPINARGEVAGLTATSELDPNAEAFCDALGYAIAPYICRPFIWRHGVMTALPTLGGTNAAASAINNRGEVTGFAETRRLDPTCPPPQMFAYAAALWDTEKGEVQELPPLLGDTISGANGINDNGEVAGASGTCAAGPIEAVLWKEGRPIDLGTLGGAVFNIAFAVNNSGQVVGQSDLPGDTSHHAFFWENGVMTDLGTLPGIASSLANSINNRGQAVGFSDDGNGNMVALIWQNGTMTDLNTLIPADSSVFLSEALGINDRGQITGYMFLPSGEVHGFLATPLEENNESVPVAQARSRETPRVTLPERVRETFRRQHRWPGLGK
jgi:probable HAF family extracellular repeat protein